MEERHNSPLGGNGRPLSTEGTVDLALQVGQLAKAGLPLAGGLAALADEVPGRRLGRVLRDMAAQLEQGKPLEDVLESQGRRLPNHVRGLVLAGVRSGQLDAILEEFVAQERTRENLRQQIASQLAYPIVLILTMAVVCLLIQQLVVEPFKQIVADLETDLRLLTQVFFESGGPVAWTLLMVALLLAVCVFFSQSLLAVNWGAELLHRVPMLGPLWRFTRLAQFARLMALLLRVEMPLPEALRLAARSARDAYLADGCRRVAEGVEAGQEFPASLARYPQFPPTLLPILQWGHQSQSLPEAFNSAAEMFEDRVTTQGNLMERVCLPVIFVFLLSYVGMMAVALFLPLFSLITNLT